MLAVPRAALVTVVLPARNEEARVGRALRSLARQTHRDHEVLVVDDGSTDRTAAVVAAHAARDPRVRMIATDGVGVTEAANTAMARVRTELVARLDADDWSFPRRLERQVAELTANPRAVAVGTWGVRFNAHGVPIGRLRVGPTGREGYRRARAARRLILLTHPSVMLRRSAFERVGGYPGEYHVGEDAALMNRLADIGEVYAVAEYLTAVTIRPGSLSDTHLEDEAWMGARLQAEATLGEPFASFEDFLVHAKRDEAGWERLRRRVDAQVDRRRFARAVAAGRAIEAARLLRANDAPTALVRAGLRRLTGGR